MRLKVFGTIVALAIASKMASAAPDLPANRTTPVQIVVGSSAASRLETAQDRDWIKLKLNAGQNVQLRLGSFCALSRAKLLDPSGRFISNIPQGVEYPGGSEFVAPKAGVYFVSFGPYAGYDSICGDGPSNPFPANWSLSAKQNCAENAKTTCVLSPTGKLVRGQIDYETEKDWFKVSIASNGSYTFDLQCGTNGSGASEPTPLADCSSEFINFSLRRSNGTIVADYKKTFTTSLAKGIYYLAVRDIDAVYGERLYTLSLRPAKG